MAISLGATRYGITAKFRDQSDNTVSKTYNGLNMTGNASVDAGIAYIVFAQGHSDSPGLFGLLGDVYEVDKIDRNANNEVIITS